MSLELSYREGVEKARAQGLIEGVPSPRFSDNHKKYSHEFGLTKTVSRVLSPIVSKLFKVLQKQDRDFRILEMGPGAGVAVSEIRHLMKNAVIHTIAGGTPINPYWQFSEEIIADAKMNGHVADVLFKYLYLQAKRVDGEVAMRGVSNVSPDKLMSLQSGISTRIFDVVERPYIDYQWCGDFLDPNPLENGSYDVVYESNGPNYHILNALSTEAYSRAQEMTKSLLAKDGILIMEKMPIQDYDVDDEFLHFPMIELGMLIHKDNFLAKGMPKSTKSMTMEQIEICLNNALDDLLYQNINAVQR